MTALWHSLDADQHAVLACGLTLLVGLAIGAAACTIAERRAAHRHHFAALEQRLNDLRQGPPEFEQVVAEFRAELDRELPVVVERWGSHG